MAVETQISAKGSRGHHTFYLKVTETGYDITTNQSTLSFDFWLVDDNNWYWSTQGTNVSYKVEIGTSYWAGYIPHHTTKTTDVRSESGLKFTHNSDGTLTLPIKFTVTDSSSISYLPGNASASGNLVCTTIPRASAISLNVSSFDVTASSGNAFQWTITPQSNTFYNKLRYTLGNKDISDNKGTGTKSGYFTNQELLNALPNTKSGTLTVYCYTYSDSNYSNLVGTKSVSITVSVSLKPSAPTLTTIGFRNRSSGVNSAITTPTAGYTTVALTDWESGTSYGASSYTTYFSVNQGATLKTSSATANDTVIETNTLPSSAKQYTLTMTAYTVDSRGNQSDNSTITCIIYGYQPPIASLQAFRTSSSSSTAEDGAGTWARVLFSPALRGQTDANGALISGNQNAVVSATCTRSGYSSGSCTSGTNYSLPDTGTMTFTYTVTDRFTTSRATVTVPTATYPLDLYDDGNGNVGVGLGAVAKANSLITPLQIMSPSEMARIVLCDVTDDEVKAQDSTLTTSSGDSAWFKALLKAICAKYPSYTVTRFVGRLSPNSQRNYEVSIYSTSTLSDGLPQYSYGLIQSLGGNVFTFGTNNYTYYFWDYVYKAGTANSATNATNATLASHADYLNLVATNEIRMGNRLTTLGDIWFNYSWSDGKYETIRSYRFGNGNEGYAYITASNFYNQYGCKAPMEYTLWTGTKMAGESAGINLNVSGYKRLRIFFNSYSNQGVFELDLEHTTQVVDTSGWSYRAVGMTYAYATNPETHFCDVRVNDAKTNVYPQRMGYYRYNSSASSISSAMDTQLRNQNSNYYVYRIDGIL